MSDKTLEESVVDMESRLVFQEDAIDHLNKVITEQHKEIDVLQQQIRYVYAQIKQLSEQQQDGAPQNDAPPHY